MNKITKILCASLLSLTFATPSFALKAKSFTGFSVGAGFGLSKTGTGPTEETNNFVKRELERVLAGAPLSLDSTVNEWAGQLDGIIAALETVPQYQPDPNLLALLTTRTGDLVKYFGADTKLSGAIDKIVSGSSTGKTSFRGEILFGYDEQLQSGVILGIQVGFGKNFGTHKFGDTEIAKDLVKAIPAIETNEDAKKFLDKACYENRFEINLRPRFGYALSRTFAVGVTPGLAIKFDKIGDKNKTTCSFMPGVFAIAKLNKSVEVGLQMEVALKAKLDDYTERKSEFRGFVSLNYRF